MENNDLHILKTSSDLKKLNPIGICHEGDRLVGMNNQKF